MTEAERELVGRYARGFGLDLSDRTLERLDRFLDLLHTWNSRIHLTGDRDRAALVRRHLIDSLVPAAHLASGLTVDLGSGAGFPGIILGCVRPDIDLALVESRRRRATFLREVVRTLELPRVRVLEQRAEAVAGEIGARAACVTARAIRIDQLLALAAPLLTPDGLVIAMQTPRARKDAASTAARLGFRPAGVHEYRLPDGEPRCLLLFALDRAS